VPLVVNVASGALYDILKRLIAKLGGTVTDSSEEFEVAEVVTASVVNQVVSKRIGQEAADALIAARCPPPAPDPYPGAQRRPGRGLPPLVPRLHAGVRPTGPGGVNSQVGPALPLRSPATGASPEPCQARSLLASGDKELREAVCGGTKVLLAAQRVSKDRYARKSALASRSDRS